MAKREPRRAADEWQSTPRSQKLGPGVAARERPWLPASSHDRLRSATGMNGFRGGLSNGSCLGAGQTRIRARTVIKNARLIKEVGVLLRGSGFELECEVQQGHGPGRPGWLPTQVPHRSGRAR